MEEQLADETSEASVDKWVGNRRVLLKAAAGVAAFAAAGGVLQTALPVPKAQAAETLAKRWIERDEVGGLSASDISKGQVVAAEFPFYAVGAHWDGSVGGWPSVELSFSNDGQNWGSPVRAHAQADGGRPSRDGRIFTPLVFTDGKQFIRYRTLDLNGNPTPVPGFAVTYLDATAGPSSGGVEGAGQPTLTKPPVVSRAGWGCNENYRFDQWGEVWPKEYQMVEKAIIHHTDTGNFNDPYAEMRSIYYYHAVEQEWGDIGYNYLVDRYGNIFQGRIGGDNVVGGHAFQYAYGSSGIGVIGNFHGSDITSACRSAIVAIVAWVIRNRDPLGSSSFKEAPNLPNICAHRNVNQSTCPGDFLYADLPGIRQSVANVLNSTQSPPDAAVPPFPSDVRFKTGACVATDRDINLRWGPDMNSELVGYCPRGTLGAVAGLPRKVGGVLWYYILTSNNGVGNIKDEYLDPAPIGNPAPPRFRDGDIVRTTDSINVRRSPGLPNRIIGYIGPGVTLEVSTNAVAATGYQWYGVYNPATAGGWVVQNYLQDITPSTVTLSRTRGIVNIWITAYVRNFPGNTKVYIQWDGENKTSVNTNGSGDADVALKIPYDTKGFHTIRAVAPSANRSDTVQYEVVPRIKCIPNSGEAGDTINISLRGYRKKEYVRIRWEHGSSWTQIGPSVLTSNTGSANVDIKVPDWSATTAKVRGDSTNTSTGGRAQTTFTKTGSGSSEPTETPTQTPTETPTQTPTATSEGTPGETVTAEPTQTPTSEATTAPTDTPAPTETPTQAPTDTPTATPTETPTATPTPEP